MMHFAVRRELGAMSLADAERVAVPEPGDPCRLLGAYWTPARGLLLSVHEGGMPAEPIPPAPAEVFSVLPITAEEYGPPEMEPAAGDGAHLPLVLVRRTLAPMTPREFRVVALQALMCAYEYTDLRWLRSYWSPDRNELHCLFRTRTHDLVREHARRSRIPCDEVHDAVELQPDLRVGGGDRIT